jgi:predicted nuclease with TOPRIM domain
LIKELEGSGGVFISMTIACKEELKILEDYEGGMYSVEEVEKLEKEIIRLQELNRKEIDRTDRLERKIADLETENAKLKAQAVHDSWALNPERMGK